MKNSLLLALLASQSTLPPSSLSLAPLSPNSLEKYLECIGDSDHYSQPSSASVLSNSDTSISEATLDLPSLRPPSREEIKTVISSLKVSPDENQWRVIGKIAYLPSKVIGLSGNGTAVFDGRYEDKPAAVKRILLSHHELAEQEISNFSASSHHQNVVRFFGMERNDDFVYLALERCDCNLAELIDQISFVDSFDKDELASNKGFDCSTTSLSLSYDVGRLEPLKNELRDVKLWKENNGRPSPLLQNLMKDMVLGLIHLHASRLIHRDLKPQNILIIKQGSTLCAKLSDMGITRQLRDDKNSLTNHFSRCGTTGWKAIEWLHHGRQTQAMDMFSLGCLLFYCITRGWHPFGEHHECETNIRKDNVKNLFLIKDFPEAFHLISLLLTADPLLRPNAIEVLHHLLFWDSEKRLSFLCDASDRLSENSNRLSEAIEATVQTTLGKEWSVWRFWSDGVQTWSKKVDDKIIKQMAPYVEWGYNFSSVGDLLRLIQNLLNRYEQLPTDIQILVGPLHEGVDDYFTSRFPMLLIEVYEVMCTHCKEETWFNKYFWGNL